MQLDDKIEIQTFAMMSALDERLAADPRTSGLVLPEEFRYEPMGSEQAYVRYGVGWHPMGGTSTRGARPDDEMRSIPQAWDRMDPAHVIPETLDALQAHAHLALRMAVQVVRPYDAPTWAAMVHPVLLALVLGHDADRTIMPLGTTPRDLDGSKRWNVDNVGNPRHDGVNGTTATGECWMDRGVLRCSRMGVVTPDMSAVTVVSIESRTTMSMPCSLPDTVKTAGLSGRRLGDVVAMPPCGHPGIDAAAADCRIASYRELANGIEVRFEPAAYIPYGIPPEGVIARCMELSPHIE